FFVPLLRRQGDTRRGFMDAFLSVETGETSGHRTVDSEKLLTLLDAGDASGAATKVLTNLQAVATDLAGTFASVSAKLDAPAVATTVVHGPSFASETAPANAEFHFVHLGFAMKLNDTSVTRHATLNMATVASAFETNCLTNQWSALGTKSAATKVPERDAPLLKVVARHITKGDYIAIEATFEAIPSLLLQPVLDAFSTSIGGSAATTFVGTCEAAVSAALNLVQAEVALVAPLDGTTTDASSDKAFVVPSVQGALSVTHTLRERRVVAAAVSTLLRDAALRTFGEQPAFVAAKCDDAVSADGSTSATSVCGFSLPSIRKSFALQAYLGAGVETSRADLFVKTVKNGLGSLAYENYASGSAVGFGEGVSDVAVSGAARHTVFVQAPAVLVATRSASNVTAGVGSAEVAVRQAQATTRDKLSVQVLQSATRAALKSQLSFSDSDAAALLPEGHSVLLVSDVAQSISSHTTQNVAAKRAIFPTQLVYYPQNNALANKMLTVLSGAFANSTQRTALGGKLRGEMLRYLSGKASGGNFADLSTVSLADVGGVYTSTGSAMLAGPTRRLDEAGLDESSRPDDAADAVDQERPREAAARNEDPLNDESVSSIPVAMRTDAYLQRRRMQMWTSDESHVTFVVPQSRSLLRMLRERARDQAVARRLQTTSSAATLVATGERSTVFLQFSGTLDAEGYFFMLAGTDGKGADRTNPVFEEDDILRTQLRNATYRALLGRTAAASSNLLRSHIAVSLAPDTRVARTDDPTRQRKFAIFARLSNFTSAEEAEMLESMVKTTNGLQTDMLAKLTDGVDMQHEIFRLRSLQIEADSIGFAPHAEVSVRLRFGGVSVSDALDKLKDTVMERIASGTLHAGAAEALSQVTGAKLEQNSVFLDYKSFDDGTKAGIFRLVVLLPDLHSATARQIRQITEGLKITKADASAPSNGTAGRSFDALEVVEQGATAAALQFQNILKLRVSAKVAGEPGPAKYDWIRVVADHASVNAAKSGGSPLNRASTAYCPDGYKVIGGGCMPAIRMTATDGMTPDSRKRTPTQWAYKRQVATWSNRVTPVPSLNAFACEAAYGPHSRNSDWPPFAHAICAAGLDVTYVESVCKSGQKKNCVENAQPWIHPVTKEPIRKAYDRSIDGHMWLKCPAGTTMVGGGCGTMEQARTLGASGPPPCPLYEKVGYPQDIEHWKDWQRLEVFTTELQDNGMNKHWYGEMRQHHPDHIAGDDSWDYSVLNGVCEWNGWRCRGALEAVSVCVATPGFDVKGVWASERENSYIFNGYYGDNGNVNNPSERGYDNYKCPDGYKYISGGGNFAEGLFSPSDALNLWYFRSERQKFKYAMCGKATAALSPPSYEVKEAALVIKDPAGSAMASRPALSVFVRVQVVPASTLVGNAAKVASTKSLLAKSIKGSAAGVYMDEGESSTMVVEDAGVKVGSVGFTLFLRLHRVPRCHDGKHEFDLLAPNDRSGLAAQLPGVSIALSEVGADALTDTRGYCKFLLGDETGGGDGTSNAAVRAAYTKIFDDVLHPSSSAYLASVAEIKSMNARTIDSNGIEQWNPDAVALASADVSSAFATQAGAEISPGVPGSVRSLHRYRDNVMAVSLLQFKLKLVIGSSSPATRLGSAQDAEQLTTHGIVPALRKAASTLEAAATATLTAAGGGADFGKELQDVGVATFSENDGLNAAARVPVGTLFADVSDESLYVAQAVVLGPETLDTLLSATYAPAISATPAAQEDFCVVQDSTRTNPTVVVQTSVFVSGAEANTHVTHAMNGAFGFLTLLRDALAAAQGSLRSGSPFAAGEAFKICVASPGEPMPQGRFLAEFNATHGADVDLGAVNTPVGLRDAFLGFSRADSLGLEAQNLRDANKVVEFVFATGFASGSGELNLASYMLTFVNPAFLKLLNCASPSVDCGPSPSTKTVGSAQDFLREYVVLDLKVAVGVTCDGLAGTFCAAHDYIEHQPPRSQSELKGILKYAAWLVAFRASGAEDATFSAGDLPSESYELFADVHPPYDFSTANATTSLTATAWEGAARVFVPVTNLKGAEILKVFVKAKAIEDLQAFLTSQGLPLTDKVRLLSTPHVTYMSESADPQRVAGVLFLEQGFVVEVSSSPRGFVKGDRGFVEFLRDVFFTALRTGDASAPKTDVFGVNSLLASQTQIAVSVAPGDAPQRRIRVAVHARNVEAVAMNALTEVLYALGEQGKALVAALNSRVTQKATAYASA
ncbi:unnamed protein product, partial [Amoebophrya sp. A25]